MYYTSRCAFVLVSRLLCVHYWDIGLGVLGVLCVNCGQRISQVAFRYQKVHFVVIWHYCIYWCEIFYCDLTRMV